MPTAYPLLSRDWIPVRGQSCPIPQHTPPLLRNGAEARVGQRRDHELLPSPFLCASVRVHGSRPRHPPLPLCGGRAWDASERGVLAARCRVPSTLLLLLAYLTLPGPGHSGVLVAGEPGRRTIPARDSSATSGRCCGTSRVNGPALDSLIRVRGASGRPGSGGSGLAERKGTGRKWHGPALIRAPPGALLRK